MRQVFISFLVCMALACGKDEKPAAEKRSGKTGSTASEEPKAASELPDDAGAVTAFVAKNAPKDMKALTTWTGGVLPTFYAVTTKALDSGKTADELLPKLQTVYDRFGRFFIAIGKLRSALSEADVVKFDRLMMRAGISRSRVVQTNIMKLSKAMRTHGKHKKLSRLLTQLFSVPRWWNLKNIEYHKDAMAHFGLTPQKNKGQLDCGTLAPLASVSKACGSKFTQMLKIGESGSGISKCSRQYTTDSGGMVRLRVRSHGVAGAKRWFDRNHNRNKTHAEYLALSGIGIAAYQHTEGPGALQVHALKGAYDVEINTVKVTGSDKPICSFAGLTTLLKGAVSQL